MSSGSGSKVQARHCFVQSSSAINAACYGDILVIGTLSLAINATLLRSRVLGYCLSWKQTIELYQTY